MSFTDSISPPPDCAACIDRTDDELPLHPREPHIAPFLPAWKLLAIILFLALCFTVLAEENRHGWTRMQVFGTTIMFISFVTLIGSGFLHFSQGADWKRYERDLDAYRAAHDLRIFRVASGILHREAELPVTNGLPGSRPIEHMPVGPVLHLRPLHPGALFPVVGIPHAWSAAIPPAGKGIVLRDGYGMTANVLTEGAALDLVQRYPSVEAYLAHIATLRDGQSKFAQKIADLSLELGGLEGTTQKLLCTLFVLYHKVELAKYAEEWIDLNHAGNIAPALFAAINNAGFDQKTLDGPHMEAYRILGETYTRATAAKAEKDAQRRRSRTSRVAAAPASA